VVPKGSQQATELEGAGRNVVGDEKPE